MATLLPIKTFNLCINCAYYSPGGKAEADTCLHPEATTGGVREQSQKTCALMRMTKCVDGALFTDK